MGGRSKIGYNFVKIPNARNAPLSNGRRRINEPMTNTVNSTARISGTPNNSMLKNGYGFMNHTRVASLASETVAILIEIQYSAAAMPMSTVKIGKRNSNDVSCMFKPIAEGAARYHPISSDVLANWYSGG